ncbi:MAG: hypothetical protein F8N36_01710 [Desulfovibrio sp.]|uniref:hypothetical protein n=1 Tax=Desulfovibrio sp. TaxID=885 RepID=UPI00135EEA5E|nr:hypothetical protein [Desulfovibrio sp.]MTJ91570.1 hypothetical protein [Desulfovibrio sp.]
MQNWWNARKETLCHVKTEDHSNHTGDNIREDIQMNSAEKWFDEKSGQVFPCKFEAFGVLVWSRYGQASEIAEMLAFVRDVAWEGLESVLEEVFYDSKASICTFVFAPKFDLKDSRASRVFLCAKKYISQFMWGDDVYNSNDIDDIVDVN